MAGRAAAAAAPLPNERAMNPRRSALVLMLVLALVLPVAACAEAPPTGAVRVCRRRTSASLRRWRGRWIATRPASDQHQTGAGGALSTKLARANNLSPSFFRFGYVVRQPICGKRKSR